MTLFLLSVGKALVGDGGDCGKEAIDWLRKRRLYGAHPHFRADALRVRRRPHLALLTLLGQPAVLIEEKLLVTFGEKPRVFQMTHLA